MGNPVNQRIYALWAPMYDVCFRPISAGARQRAIDMLALHPGERLFIPGIGTGLDLPRLPGGLTTVGLDFSRAMLTRARQKTQDQHALLLHGDARTLPFPPASFDALLFNLFLSVVPDPALVFGACWQILRPGGRAAIFDKFLPEQGQLTAVRRALGALIRGLGTDPNRKLSAIIAGLPDVEIVSDCPSLLRGQYRILLLKKC